MDKQLPEIGSWVSYNTGLGWIYGDVVGHRDWVQSKGRPIQVRYFYNQDYEDRSRSISPTYRERVLETTSDEYIFLYPTRWRPATDGPCDEFKQIYKSEILPASGEIVYHLLDTLREFAKWCHAEIRVTRFAEDFRIKIFLNEYGQSKGNRGSVYDGAFGKQVRLIFRENEEKVWRKYLTQKTVEFYENNDMPLSWRAE